MTKVELSIAAQRDLRSIYEYSKKTFGKDQALEYVRGLRNTLGLLESNPNLGRRDQAINEIVFRLVYRQNIIFYTGDRDHLVIRRILDARQDPMRHL